VDDRKPYGETSFRTMSYIGLRLYVMIFTLRNTVVRLVSLAASPTRER
jgi:hypothetical protein